jgi:RHH-type proline utilization regulon transcriptional repressor/proline dehydrogenase/delta 1-pyrroline-5-carboxylate dehydrogenase
LVEEAAAQPHLEWLSLVPVLRTVQEEESAFLGRLQMFERVRLAAKPSDALRVAAAKAGVYLIEDIVLASGRWELLHYLQEVSLSVDYHRYGNLGLREGELRKQIF